MGKVLRDGLKEEKKDKMTQILVINDTSAQIAPGDILLDGINQVPPVEEILHAVLMNMYNCADTTQCATPTIMTVLDATIAGYNVSLESATSIAIGVAMETYHVLVLNVRLKGEIVRT